ncbi:MAG: septal ring lytic transglycosylase RlpA family protein [Patescibacteria group bacterium]
MDLNKIKNNYLGRFLICFFVGVAFLAIFSLSAKAEDFVSIRVVDYPLNEDFIVDSPQGEVSLKISAGAVDKKTTVKMMNLVYQDNISGIFTYNSNLLPASDLYFVRFSDSQFEIQPEVTVKYQPDDRYKEIYYYNWNDLKFEKLISRRDELQKTLTFSFPVKDNLIFAVFSESEVVGVASWYIYPKYAGQLIAASRDLAKDAKVKVVNLDNKKEVTVTIKDFGPKKCADWTEEEIRKMGPCQDRIIDLSKEAFRVLAPTWSGVISVKILPL